MQNQPHAFKDLLLYALSAYHIRVLADEGELLRLEKGYAVEIEQNGVYKLKHEGLVVAPFRDLDEMCSFIKMG